MEGDNRRPPTDPTPQRTPPPSIQVSEDVTGTTEVAPAVYALRPGEPLPDGYTLMVRGQDCSNVGTIPTATVDLTTPPHAAARGPGEDVDNEKRKSSEGRLSTRTTNKRAQTTFVKEVKASLAGGRPPELHLPEDQTHLKARWHSAAKTAAYKFLDMRKDSWKAYSMFEKAKVHKEINTVYKFDPPLDPKRVDKYLAAHLRSSRAVWKAHWLRNGDENRHPNCPEEAWETLIKWWCTEQCMEESAEMVNRRKLVQQSSKTGRTRLVDRMEEQVRSL